MLRDRMLTAIANSRFTSVGYITVERYLNAPELDCEVLDISAPGKPTLRGIIPYRELDNADDVYTLRVQYLIAGIKEHWFKRSNSLIVHLPERSRRPWEYAHSQTVATR